RYGHHGRVRSQHRRVGAAATGTSNFVRYASNPILSNSDCLTYWTPIYLGAENICMSGAGGRSPCFGDSGGPLTVSIDAGRSLLVGITSFGAAIGCAAGYPSVFVRVSYYRDWIQQNSDYCNIPNKM
uniref:Peptidase S1 domain-containing protein n=1 Tax=Anopheles atroparvus TaxID=41427 RepID=A0AAG5DEY6_ANOAO